MERSVLDNEMHLARLVMQGLLPAKPPRMKGLDIATFHEWSRDVSGDYYDFIPLGDDRWGLVIADVVGKGIAAALLVSAIRASLASLAGVELALRAIFRRANRFFRDSVESGRELKVFYATIFYAVLDVPSRRLIYVNAGHLPGLLVRADGRVDLLSEGGIPLGLFDEPRYCEGFDHMATGDVLALFTDGVTDASGPGDEPYGLDRLTRIVRDARNLDAASIRDAVVSDLRSVAADPGSNDDETLVIIKAV
jgi:sigma-B regulation protein RsbU (phosphoserine phosphatase)